MKITKTRYSIEPKDRIYVKGYGLLSFPKNKGKTLSNKYGQKLLDSAKKSTTCNKNSIENRIWIYVKGYGFLYFAKNMGKCLSNKYGQKLLDSTKKSTADAIKTASKTVIQKPAEATGDLIGNKIADKITIVLKKKPAKELHNNDDEDVEITTHNKRYISPEEREQIIGVLRLVPKKYV